MKFATSQKESKNTTRVEFVDAKITTFVERDGSKILRVGVGTEKKHTLRTLRIFVRRLTEELKKYEITSASLPGVKELLLGVEIKAHELGELYAYNVLIAAYSFARYKTKQNDKHIESITFREEKNESFNRGLKHGTTIANAVNEARSLANTPGGDMTPSLLANEALRLLRGTKARVTVLKKQQIEKLKMGALLGVARGSKEDPRFIVIEYFGGKKNDAPIVFVGKGITFDSGGLNLKPSDGILDMHLDMSGGAAVIGALRAIADLGIKRNVVGLIPSAENMVSGESYRPGDVLTTMSGKTVDVLNTDAEGRLVLADALTYAEKYKPALVVDVATLTGAALVALGQHASAVMTKDAALSERLCRFGEETGDYLWPLPLWEEYIRYTKGIHGDIANIQSSGNGRYGGAINGGAFLSHFTQKYPWAHIDTAPRMTPAPGDHLAKGATGEPTALLVKIAEKF